MKRILIIFTISVLVAAAAFGQEEPATETETTTIYEPAFMPRAPQIMGQGGSFTANAYGYYSLFTNPAAFGGKRGSLTLVSAMPWAYVPVDPEQLEELVTIAESGEEPDIATLVGEFAGMFTGNGVGAGVHAGLGYVGSNFGIGFATVADTYAWGKNLLGVEVQANVTAGAIAGLSIPIPIGPFMLRAGGSIKPMYRVSARGMDVMNVASLASGDENATISAGIYHGTAIGFDLGAMVEYEGLTGAIVIRDLFGTEFMYTRSTFDEFAAAVEETGSLPEEGAPIEEGVRYVIPMSVHTGVSFHPDLGSFSILIDPTVHAEYEISLAETPQTLWTGLHLGAEVRLLRFLSVRAGLNQGYVTFGAGAHLLFLDVQMSYFSREMGSFAGARQSQGVSLEASLRF